MSAIHVLINFVTAHGDPICQGNRCGYIVLLLKRAHNHCLAKVSLIPRLAWE